MGPGERLSARIAAHMLIFVLLWRLLKLVLPATATLSGYFAGHIYQPNIKRRGAAVSVAALLH